MESIVTERFSQNFVFSSFGSKNFVESLRQEEERKIVLTEISSSENYVPIKETSFVKDIGCEKFDRDDQSASFVDWKLWNDHVDEFPIWKTKATRLFKQTLLFDSKIEKQNLDEADKCFIDELEFDSKSSSWIFSKVYSSKLEPLIEKLNHLNSIGFQNWKYLFEKSKQRIIDVCSPTFSSSLSIEKTQAKETLEFFIEWKANYEIVLSNYLID